MKIEIGKPTKYASGAMVTTFVATAENGNTLKGHLHGQNLELLAYLPVYDEELWEQVKQYMTGYRQ